MLLFPFADYWTLYAFFTAFVACILALDLGVFHKRPHEVSFKESAIWTVIWISLALVFNYALYEYSKHAFTTNARYLSIPGFDPLLQAKNVALEFLTGYTVEKTLAIDNIFVFALVFSYFQVPKIYQHRILFWGIIGAFVFRGIFISIGSVLMQYHEVVIFFGVLLIFTGIKIVFSTGKQPSLENNFAIRMLKKLFRVHPEIAGNKFFIRKNGLIYVTPLFLALIFLELSDVIFAIDSVPAIFAITKEPFIVFTSNIFAILGLRSMYFMLGGVMDKFIYINYGLAAILIFVGLKMIWLNNLYGGKFPISYSLAIIAGLLATCIVASLIREKLKKPVE